MHDQDRADAGLSLQVQVPVVGPVTRSSPEEYSSCATHYHPYRTIQSTLQMANMEELRKSPLRNEVLR